MRRKLAKILGVTLASPAFLDLAVEAVKHWRDATGQECIILTPPDDAAAHMVKLRIPELVRPGPICFFDADLWFLRPCEPWKLLKPGHFSAVHDVGVSNSNTFAFSDCKTLGIGSQKYFNSGFFVCDTSEAAIKKAFLAAQFLAMTKKVKDFGEQSYLNKAAQEEAAVSLVDPAWNVGPWAAIAGLVPSIPGEIIGLHALGIPGHLKRERLELWKSAFHPSLAPDLKPYNG